MTQRLARVIPQVKVTQKSQAEGFMFVLDSEEFRPQVMSAVPSYWNSQSDRQTDTH